MIITESSKKRHFLLTFFLSVFFIADFLLLKSLFSVNDSGDLDLENYIFGFLSIADIIFIVFLFYWKKWAFWGALFTSMSTFIINLTLGVGFISIAGLLGILIIFLLLQLKRDGVKGWDNLE